MLGGVALVACGARAQVGTAGGEGGGVIACGSDDACVSLGPGSYCDGASCVAPSVEQMPDRFDVLTLGRTLSDADVASDTQCDPTVQVTNIEVNRLTRRLTLSTCEPVPGSNRYTVERTRRTLGDAELDVVDDAYHAVHLRTEAGCDSGDELFTLDVQLPTGALYRYADEDRAACRGPDEPRTGAVVGLEDLYEVLLRLGTGD